MAYTITGAFGVEPDELTGLYVWRTWLIAVDVFRKLWAIHESAPNTWIALSDATAPTQLDGGTRPVFSEDGIRVIIAGGGLIQQWQGIGLSSRLGAGPACTHVASLGTRLVANDTSDPQIYAWSNQFDGGHTTWDALASDVADARPDPIVAIHENLRELFLFGSTTTQIFSVGSDPFFPFDFTAATNIGVYAPYSIVRVDDMFAFLDDKRRFVMSDGRTLTPISEDISKDLREIETVDCWGYREDFKQFFNIVWTFPTAGRTFVFNVARRTWSERRTYQAPFQVNFPTQAYAFWPAINKHFVGRESVLDADTRTDFGETLLCERYTGWLDGGTQTQKRDDYLNVVVRRGTVPLGTTESALEVRCRDDGGAWSDFDFVLLGQPEDAEQTVQVRLGGVYRRRQYHFRYSGAHNISLVSAEQFFEDLEQEAA